MNEISLKSPLLFHIFYVFLDDIRVDELLAAISGESEWIHPELRAAVPILDVDTSSGPSTADLADVATAAREWLGSCYGYLFHGRFEL